MPDNEVRLIITTDNSDAIKGIQQTNDGLKTINSGLLDMNVSLGKVAAGLGVFYGVKETIDRIIDASRASLKFLGQMETSTLGIASAYMVGGKYIDQITGKTIEGERALKIALQDSKSMLDELQVANLQTIATLDQLVRAYQETLPVAMAKGFNRQMAKDFTVAMVQAAGAIGLPLDQMGEETRSILTGNINSRTSRIATVLGLRNEDIRAMEGDANRLFTFLMGKLEAYRVAGIESQRTWAGLWSNIKDIALQAGGRMVDPLFDAIKAQLMEITADIVKINEKTQKIEWNKNFVSTIETVRDIINTVIADITRLGMFLDKVGGTLTQIAHVLTQGGTKSFIQGYRSMTDELGLTEPGAVAEPTPSVFENLNKALLERYKAGERRLMDMAMRAEGLKRATSEQTAVLDYGLSPEAAGLTKVITDLGQILYYYKEINTEKTKYQVNPAKQTEEQKKAIEDWAKTIRGLETQVGKTMGDKLSGEILEIENKFKDLTQKAAQEMREKGVKLPTGYLEIWKQTMIAAEQWKDQWSKYEEQIKLREEGEKKYAELVDTLATSTENVRENRINKSIIDETKFTKSLVDIWASGAITFQRYQDTLTMRENRGIRERQKMRAEDANQDREEIIRRQLSSLDRAEKEMTMTRPEIARERVAAMKDLLRAQEEYLASLDRTKDPVAWQNQQRAIDETRSRLIDLDLVLKEQAGLYSEGLIWGIKEYGYTMRTEFQMGRDQVRAQTGAMKESFSGLFRDMRKGEMKSFEDYFISFTDKLCSYWEDMLAEMLVNWVMTSQAMKGASGGGSGLFGSFFASLFGGDNSPSYNISPGYGYEGMDNTSYLADIGGGVYAKGGVNYSPALARLENTILERPVIFPMARGAYGIAGEGGRPEGVFPLVRTRSGDLGVQAVAAPGGGDTYNVTILAVDSKSFADLVERDPSAVVKVVNRSLKNNTLGVRDSIKRYTR